MSEDLTPREPRSFPRLAIPVAAAVLLGAAVLFGTRGAGDVKRAAGASPASAARTPAPTPPIVSVYQCRRGAEFHVSPEEAEVALNGRVIGIADQWDNAGGGRQYLFDHPGSYYARLKLRGYQTTWVKIVVEPLAENEIAKVKYKMPKKVG